MTRRVLSKTTPFNSLFIKKTRNGVVLNGTADFLLPLDVKRNRGRKLRSPVFSPPFFLLLVQKDADQGPPTYPKFSTCWGAVEGRQHSGHPVLFLPCFLPIKTREERAKWRDNEKDRRREEREQNRGGLPKEKKKKEKEAEKRTKNRERERRKKNRANADHHEPPA